MPQHQTPVPCDNVVTEWHKRHLRSLQSPTLCSVTAGRQESDTHTGMGCWRSLPGMTGYSLGSHTHLIHKCEGDETGQLWRYTQFQILYSLPAQGLGGSALLRFSFPIWIMGDFLSSLIYLHGELKILGTQ